MERRSFLKAALAGVPFMNIPDISAGEYANAQEIEIRIPRGLKQEVWEIAQEPGKLSRLCPEAHSYEEDDSFLYAYALYIESGDHIAAIDCRCSSFEMVEPKFTFEDLIIGLAPRTWNDLMFGLTLYQFGINEWTNPEYNVRKDPFWSDPIGNWPKFKPSKIVDAFLSSSRGAIMWAEQLHSLYLLCDPNRQNAIRFRKGLNAKKPEAYHQLCGLHLPDGTALQEVLDERMIFSSTRHPDCRAFTAVVKHFLGQNKIQ